MRTLFEKIGLLEPKPIDGRIIYLSNGEKVIAPPKPEKLRVSYSIIPEDTLNLPDYLTCVKLRKLEPSNSCFRKIYL